ncbi:MAG: sugar phosphate isomerase/epimerase family protein [Thermoleophilaceae bacterium]
MRLGHQTNAWGGVVGHPVGVTSIKDLFYLTPGDTLATLGEVAAAGYEGVEVFDGNLAELADDPGRLRAALDEHGLSLIGVYSGANLVYPEILPEELWRIRKACEWAAELGAEHLVVGGGAQRTEPPADSDYDRLAAGLDEVARIAAGHGLVASFHPHLSTIVESPEQIERVFSRSGIHFCPDTGHLQAAGGDPVELVRTYRERIAYVHIKDLDASGGFVPLGQGVLDVAGVLAALRDSGFDGWLTVETDGWPGDPSEGARASMDHLRALLN